MKWQKYLNSSTTATYESLIKLGQHDRYRASIILHQIGSDPPRA